jgi:hypothetical protein
MTLTYGAALMSAALCPAALVLRERFGALAGLLPIPAVHGTSAPVAAHAAQTQNVVDRKADGWVPPRGRTL